jgi:flagellar biosynthesis component FlhA
MEIAWFNKEKENETFAFIIIYISSHLLFFLFWMAHLLLPAPNFLLHVILIFALTGTCIVIKANGHRSLESPR